MKPFRIVPLSAEYAQKIRKTKMDYFVNTLIEQVATGRGPCRVSLQPFTTGEDMRLLLSHNPFMVGNAFNQPGPIFINKEEVEAYKDIHRFPPAIKMDKEHFHLTLIGYDKWQMMVIAQLVGDDDVDELIMKIFDEHPEVVYLHARSAEVCCYICKIERV